MEAQKGPPKVAHCLTNSEYFFRGTHFILLVCHKNLLRSKICFFLTLLSSLYQDVLNGWEIKYCFTTYLATTEFMNMTETYACSNQRVIYCLVWLVLQGISCQEVFRRKYRKNKKINICAEVSSFIKQSDSKPAGLLKEDSKTRCFPVNFA